MVEFKSMFMIFKSFDCGGLWYVNLVKSIYLNGFIDENFYSFEYYEVWNEISLVCIGVFDENGEEFDEYEFNLCKWEWIMVVRVLD